MENNLSNIKDKMNETVLRDINFNDMLEQRVLSSIKDKKSHLFPFRNKFNFLLSLAVTTAFFLGIAYFVGTQLHLFNGSQGNNASKPKEKIIETTKNGIGNTSSEKPNNIIKYDNLAPETVFSQLKKYLPQNVLDNMPDFKQEGINESTLYLWSKKDPDSDNFIHKIEFSFNENGLKQYHYKNYSSDLKGNKISKGAAEKMVENFSKDFISDGDHLSFVNKPAYDSLYEKDVVESWVAEKNNKDYIVMVNLRYGFVEFFTTEAKSTTSSKGPNDIINDDNIASICPFELTHNEVKAYESFQSDLNLKHLEGLGPISIAKLYVKAGFDKKYNVQYALYTDRSEYVLWSKEEDEKIPESDRGTNEQNHLLFKNLDKGRFVQTSDYQGYIEYDSSDSSEAKSGFKMIKNESGVWHVAFMPIQ